VGEVGHIRWPPLSVGGASLARPFFRFQTPLIEPDVRISRIRLSDKASRPCFGVRRRLQPLDAFRDCQAHRQSPVLRRFLRPPSTKAPSLGRDWRRLRYYGPLRRPTRPGGVPRGSPVGGHTPPRRASRVCAGSLSPTCRRHYPGRITRARSLVPAARHRPSPSLGRVGSYVKSLGACSAFTRVAARRLAESPWDPFHRRLRRLRCLRRRSDCYRLERPSCRAVSAPAENQRRSRRTK